MFCKYCGTQIAENSRFCSNCGKTIDENVATGTNTVNMNTAYGNQSNSSPSIDWICNKCGEVNKGERQICMGCGEGKPVNAHIINSPSNSSMNENVFKSPTSKWKCSYCGGLNYWHDSFCSQCSHKRVMDWGTGIKVWFIVCIIGGILGLIALFAMKNELDQYDTYELYKLLGGKDLIGPLLIIAQVLYILGYLILLINKNKLGFFSIIAGNILCIYYYIDMSSVFNNLGAGSSVATGIIGGLINPLITFLILRKYWSDLKSPSQMFKS